MKDPAPNSPSATRTHHIIDDITNWKKKRATRTIFAKHRPGIIVSSDPFEDYIVTNSLT